MERTCPFRNVPLHSARLFAKLRFLRFSCVLALLLLHRYRWKRVAGPRSHSRPGLTAELTLKLQLSSFVFRKCRENTDTVSLQKLALQVCSSCVFAAQISAERHGRTWLSQRSGFHRRVESFSQTLSFADSVGKYRHSQLAEIVAALDTTLPKQSRKSAATTLC